MKLEETTEYVSSKPYMTIFMIIINIIVFIILESMGDTNDAGFMLDHGAIYPDKIIYEEEYWRFFTATFMHFGFQHIMNNMIMLGVSGKILEDAMGHIKFTILYIFAGIGGSILSFMQMYNSGEYAVSAGASGAIFGIIGALLWVIIRNKGQFEDITGKGIILVIGLSMYYGLTTGGVDNWGHVGGLASGFIIGIILYRKRPVNIDFIQENQYTK